MPLPSAPGESIDDVAVAPVPAARPRCPASVIPSGWSDRVEVPLGAEVRAAPWDPEGDIALLGHAIVRREGEHRHGLVPRRGLDARDSIPSCPGPGDHRPGRHHRLARRPGAEHPGRERAPTGSGAGTTPDPALGGTRVGASHVAVFPSWRRCSSPGCSSHPSGGGGGGVALRW